MGLLKSLDVFKLFRRKKDSHYRVLPTDPQQIIELKKQMQALEQQVGYAQGEAASQRSQRDKLAKVISNKKQVNVTGVLENKAKKMSEARFQGAISMRGMFKFLEKNPILVRSYNKAKTFGWLMDIKIMKDKRLVLVVKDKKGKMQNLMVGSRLDDIFRNITGLGNEIRDKSVCINMDDKFDYVENIEEKEVPRVIEVMDQEGHMVLAISRFDYQKVIEQLGSLTSQLNDNISYAKGLEQQHGALIEKMRMIELGETMHSARADTAEAGLKKTAASMVESMKGYGKIADELVYTSNQQKLHEDLNTRLQEQTSKLFDKIAAKLPLEIREQVRDEIKNNYQEVAGMIADAIAEQTKNAPPVPDVKVIQQPPAAAQRRA